jgi:hypothetical protein
VDVPLLISLSENYGVIADTPTWTVYPDVGEPRRVPPEVSAAGPYVRHVLVVGTFGCELWWQVSRDCVKWYYVQQTA